MTTPGTRRDRTCPRGLGGSQSNSTYEALALTDLACNFIGPQIPPCSKWFRSSQKASVGLTDSGLRRQLLETRGLYPPLSITHPCCPRSPVSWSTLPDNFLTHTIAWVSVVGVQTPWELCLLPCHAPKTVQPTCPSAPKILN